MAHHGRIRRAAAMPLRRAALLAVCFLTLSAAQPPLAAHAAQGGPPAVALRLAGDSGMVGLARLLANGYAATGHARLVVSASSGKEGFAAACSGQIVIGLGELPIQATEHSEPGCGDMISIPVAFAGVAVVYNFPGAALARRTFDGSPPLHGLQLTRAVLAGIYQGKIRTWDDPALAAINPGATLPRQPIRIFGNTEASGPGTLLTEWLGYLQPPFGPVQRCGSSPRTQPWRVLLRAHRTRWGTLRLRVRSRPI